MTKQIYWSGALDACQVSGLPFEDVMYDANIPGMGWGNINQATFDALGCRLGVGKGQRYRKQPDGRWLQVAGGEHTPLAEVVELRDDRVKPTPPGTPTYAEFAARTGVAGRAVVLSEDDRRAITEEAASRRRG